MKAPLNGLLLSCVLLFSLSAFSDTYFVQETATGALSKEDASTTTELIRSTINETGSHQTVGNAASAQYVLEPKLLKLGNSYIMPLQKQKAGKVVFSSQLKAKSIDELDGIVARLVRAVIDEVPVKADVRVNDVTETEAVSGTRRKEAQKHWYFGFGPYGSNNLGDNGVLYDLDIAYAWDVNSFSIKIFWDGAFPGSNSGSNAFSDLGLGLNYFMKDTDMTPILEGDLGYGGANSTSGFVGGVGFGWEFFRTSSINFEILLRYAVLFNQTPIGTPSVYGLRIGLYF